MPALDGAQADAGLSGARPCGRRDLCPGDVCGGPAACPSVFPSLCLSAGQYNYGFECVDCAEGTFSGGSDGRCDPWADLYSHILQGKPPDSCAAGAMRTCVGARWPGALRSALLLLGLGAAAQPVCKENTYPRGNKCCKECDPGFQMVSRCTESQDSVCVPCRPGFYNEAVNYDACKPCTQCNQRSGSKIKRMCTATNDTVCSCRPGTQPRGGFKRGVAAPWRGRAPCGLAATALMPSVRAGRLRSPSLRRPKAPQPSPPPPSPPPPGPGPHRGLLCPLQSPPGALSWPPSWAWGCAWASWPRRLPRWSCCSTTRPGGCPPTTPRVLEGAAAGRPSKRSTRTPTPPWPSSERRRWGAASARAPLQPASSSPCHPGTFPGSSLCRPVPRAPCGPPCAVLGAPGLAPGSAMYAVHTPPGAAPNKQPRLMRPQSGPLWARVRWTELRGAGSRSEGLGPWGGEAPPTPMRPVAWCRGSSGVLGSAPVVRG
ncbi:tumor necrosis factor receptor superfamily member 4 isoform 1-T1 [Glossophaga mutica]